MAKIDAENLKTLVDQIEKLPQRTTMTPYEVVKQLAPSIEGACGRGQDFAAIAKILKGLGVHLAPETVGNYVRRARREAARSSATEASPVAVPAASSRESVSSSTSKRAEDARPSRRDPQAATPPIGGRFELVEDKKDL